jgi:methionyl-tRNA formyltransferase
MSNNADTRSRLRVFLVTEDDPIYVIKFFEVFFAECPDYITVCGMAIDKPFHEALFKTFMRMLRFYGPKDTLRQGARYLGAKLRNASIPALAAHRGIPVIETPTVNDPSFVEGLRSLELDLVISIAAPEIFKKDLLEAPRLGCINMHSGKLPEYRGMMPTFWQMLHGEPHITISVHQMVQKLDAGDLLATRAFPIKEADSLDRIITGTKREGARLLIDVLGQLHRSEIRPIPLLHSRASYYSFPKGPDVRAFRKLGHRMI